MDLDVLTFTHPWSWPASPLRSWVSVGTASRSQESLEDEAGSEGKASAKTAAYRRHRDTSAVSIATRNDSIKLIRRNPSTQKA